MTVCLEQPPAKLVGLLITWQKHAAKSCKIFIKITSQLGLPFYITYFSYMFNFVYFVFFFYLIVPNIDMRVQSIPASPARIQCFYDSYRRVQSLPDNYTPCTAAKLF